MQTAHSAAALVLLAVSVQSLKLTYDGDASVRLPASLTDSLVLRLEADRGVEIDSRGKKAGFAPAVRLWRDVDDTKREASANSTLAANLKQRLLNHKTDRTRHTHETWSLPLAKRRAAAGLPDSAPALVKDPVLGVPGLFFDGDDYLSLPIEGKHDSLVPGEEPMTVVVMLNVAKPEKGQEFNVNRWLGLGNPGEYSSSQFNLETALQKSEKTGDIEATAIVRVVPVADNVDTPSVRQSATIEAPIPVGKPVLLSFVLDGHGLSAAIDGDASVFKKDAGGFFEGESDGWSYMGPVDPLADEPKASFQIGASPASEELFTGEGAYGTLYGALIFKSKLDNEKLETAEMYLACHFHIEARCDRERASELGLLGKAGLKKHPLRQRLRHTVSLVTPIGEGAHQSAKAVEERTTSKDMHCEDGKWNDCYKRDYIDSRSVPAQVKSRAFKQRPWSVLAVFLAAALTHYRH